MSEKHIDILHDDYQCPIFTATGDRALDHLILQQLRTVLIELKQCLDINDIEALILGGGYGRGEGGAFGDPGNYKPYNDYDLVLVHRFRASDALDTLLRRIHNVYSEKFNVHVDITPVKQDKLANLPQALTWYELYKGHQVLYGNQNSLKALEKRKLLDVPETEWGRLLVNRGSGLLYSLWKHQHKPCSVGNEESFEKFATRQIEKAWLALGDVWLAKRNRYDAQVINRRKKWQAARDELPSWSDYYLNAVDFKLNPVFNKSRLQIIEELSILSKLYSNQLKLIKASRIRPLIGAYYTLKHINPALWLLSNPLNYPRERMRHSLCQELLGYTLTRKRLIGDTEKYIRLWELFG